MGEGLPVVLVAGLGVATGALVLRLLAPLSYRRGDETGRPRPRVRWWVVPGVALAWMLLWLGPLERGASTGAAALTVMLGSAAVLVALAAIDLDVHRLPDRVLLPATAASVLLLGLQQGVAPVAGQSWARALLAGAVVGVGHLVLALLTAHRGGLGFGDVKLAGWLGILLGWWGWGAVLGGVVAAVLVGGLGALVLLLTRRAGPGTHLAYGPALACGALLGLLGPHDATSLLLG